MSTNRPFDVMACLRQRVPITLLIDLLDPRGPGSREIMHLDDLDGQPSPTTVLWRTASSSAR